MQKSSDKLTVYMVPIARRSLTIYPPATSGSEIAIDLPVAFVKNSATALFGKLKILPLRFQGQQILVTLPVGKAIVEKDGTSYIGTLESVGPYDATLRLDKENNLIRISNYTSISLDSRFDTPKVSLSYSMRNIYWSAEHTVLIDSKSNQVIGLQSVAKVINDSGIVFNNLNNLILSFGKPIQDFGAVEREQFVESKTMYAAAPMAKMSRQSISRDQVRDSEDTSEMETSGIDYEIPLGPQQLKQDKVFTIRDMEAKEIVSQRIFSHQLQQGNQVVQMGFKITMPSSTILPAGLLKVIEIDHETDEPGAFLGSTMIPEFRGTTSGVSDESFPIIESDTESDAISKDDSNDFVFLIGQSKDVSASTTIQSQTVSGKGQVTPSPVTPLEESTPSERQLGLDITTINISTQLKNHMKKPAQMVLNYPIPYQNVLSVDPKYSRVKNGKWKWDIELAPLESRTVAIVIKYAE